MLFLVGVMASLSLVRAGLLCPWARAVLLCPGYDRPPGRQNNPPLWRVQAEKEMGFVQRCGVPYLLGSLGVPAGAVIWTGVSPVFLVNLLGDLQTMGWVKRQTSRHICSWEGADDLSSLMVRRALSSANRQVGSCQLCSNLVSVFWIQSMCCLRVYQLILFGSYYSVLGAPPSTTHRN